MEIHFTRHATARMEERGITADEVRFTLENPVQLLDAKEGSKEAQGWLERDGKRLLLRVIYRDGVVVTVITVMATSKLAKYGVSHEI